MSDRVSNVAVGSRESQIREIIDHVLERRTRGEPISDDAICQEHARLLPELAAELHKLGVIARARDQSRHSAADRSSLATEETTAYVPTVVQVERLSRSLQIRCPLCHEPLEIAADSPLDDIACAACQGRFNLAGDDPDLKELEPLTRLGRFELLQRLGMGGFGTVWKARDAELERIVAIKIPRRGNLSRDQVDEFLHEARVAAKLRHPNIVSVHEIGREGDNVYIVSDLVAGISLEKYKNKKRLTQREVAELLVTVSDALHFAHEVGIVHRDLKPGNILIDDEGRPHITDFGLAKRGRDEVDITTQGQVLGTPAYMAPEQARGEAHLADRRTDVYALGVMLFELLTDARPFRGNVVAVMQQVMHKEPTSPRRLNPAVSHDLETICLKCLEKRPDRRYGTAQELADELRRFLSGDEILARPISRTERLWRWCRKNPRIPMLSAALLAVTLLAYAAAWFWFERQMRATDRALTERALANVHFTAESVAASAGRDLEQYFDLVEDAVRQPALIEQLRRMHASTELRELSTHLSDKSLADNALTETDSQAAQSLRKQFEHDPVRQALQHWTEDFGDDLPVFASFVLFADGLQIARHPIEGGQTIGRNYAWRAYFTGHDRDKAKSWRPASSHDHLQKTCLSPPFVSEFTDEWVIVITTPVIDPQNNDFLGAMGIMVQLGAFAKLPGNASSLVGSPASNSAFAVLVDTRPSQQGQILQHPLFRELDDRQLESNAISPRRKLLDRSQEEPNFHVAMTGSPLDGNYRDPLAQVSSRYATRWLASRLPLNVRGNACGLAIIVQENYDQIIGQPLSTMRHGLALLSLSTLLLSAAAIVPLWGIILRLVR